MAEVNAKDLTTKTTPASTDSMLLFGTTSNEGAKITVDNLADNILGRLTTKTFANQVGGSSAATLLAQLSTLNSNFPNTHESITLTAGAVVSSLSDTYCRKYGRIVMFQCVAKISTESDTGVIATGLPVPVEAFNIVGLDVYGYAIRGRVSSNGLQLWWGKKPTVNDTVVFSGMYLCQ